MTLLLNLKKKKRLGYLELLKKYAVYIIPSILILIVLIFLSPYIFRSWTSYPEDLKAEIAWRKFAESFNGNCRESCLASRQSYASIWRPIYRKNPEQQEEKLKIVFAGENLELQAAMIKIMAADYDSISLPPYFAELLMDPNISEENKRLIVVFFPEAFHDEAWLSMIRERVSSIALSDPDKAYALSLLSPYPEGNNIQLIKHIVLTSDNRIILDAAFRVLSAWEKEYLSWSEEELDRIRDLIININKKELAWRRIWLLSENTSLSSIKRKERLGQIASNNNLDSISRGLAAESLRLEFSIEINTPEPTSAEWQELYDYL